MSYWDQVRKMAFRLHSDGCTGATELYHDCCLEHDIAYRTGGNIFGERRTRAQADARFRRCMQARSWFGKWSVVAWARWAVVRVVGGFNWRG